MKNGYFLQKVQMFVSMIVGRRRALINDNKSSAIISEESIDRAHFWQEFKAIYPILHSLFFI